MLPARAVSAAPARPGPEAVRGGEALGRRAGAITPAGYARPAELAERHADRPTPTGPPIGTSAPAASARPARRSPRCHLRARRVAHRRS